MSLNPLSEHNSTITKHLPCVSHGMRTFSSTSSNKMTISRNFSVKDCGLGIYFWKRHQTLKIQCIQGCLHSWTYWLHPDHWMESVWSQTRLLILCTVLLLLIIILGLFSKFCCCLFKLKTKSKKNKSSMKIFFDNWNIFSVFISLSINFSQWKIITDYLLIRKNV